MPSRTRNFFSGPIARRMSSASTVDYKTDYPLVIKRIQLLAASLIAVTIFEVLLSLVLMKLAPEFFADQRHDGRLALVMAILLSVLALITLRIKSIPLMVQLTICFVYVFGVTILIAAGELAAPWWIDGGRMRGLPWVSIWLLLVPVVVPIGQKRGLGRSLGLSIVPVLVMFSGIRWFGLPPAPATAYLDLYVPCLLTSAMAFVVSRMMVGLAGQVQQAQMLGSYHLEEQIGAGGMGEVWRARHQMLVRPAAVKLIRAKNMTDVAVSDSDSIVSRFKREAQATACLRSPHTVELYDFGLAEDGTFFYVMELLEGLDLQKLVKRFGPLPAERTIFLLTQICDSLADAHAAGLMHRDIKPANIYVCRLGLKTDFVKVLDFGLVKSVVRDQGDLTLTMDQAVIGTPAFLSPESISGGSTDLRMDIYSLGCVAYWLLTGNLVFESESPLAMAVAHAKEEPVPPSKKSELPIPEELDSIILDCLAKNPADRPDSAAALSARLAQCPCDKPWTDQMAQHWWNAHLPETDRVNEVTGQSGSSGKTRA